MRIRSWRSKNVGTSQTHLWKSTFQAFLTPELKTRSGLDILEGNALLAAKMRQGCCTKDQIISEAIFLGFISPKKQTKFFKGLLP